MAKVTSPNPYIHHMQRQGDPQHKPLPAFLGTVTALTGVCCASAEDSSCYEWLNMKDMQVPPLDLKWTFC